MTLFLNFRAFQRLAASSQIIPVSQLRQWAPTVAHLHNKELHNVGVPLDPWAVASNPEPLPPKAPKTILSSVKFVMDTSGTLNSYEITCSLYTRSKFIQK